MLEKDTVLIHNNLIRQSRHGSVHVGAAQLLGTNDLSRGHLDEGRAAEKDLRLALDEYRVVGQGRVVGASGCRGAKHDGARLEALLRADGEVAEDLSALVEDAELLGEKDSGLERRC